MRPIRRWSRSSRPTSRTWRSTITPARRRAKSNDDYAAAARWYRAYLSSFPGEPDSAATNYLLADALFESKQYLTRRGEYEHTAYGYPPHAQAAEAGYAALVAYQKYEDALPPEARAPRCICAPPIRR